MLKQQLIIAVAALAFVILLFSLPKVLLNKEEKELESSAELSKAQPAPTHSESNHGKISFSESEKQQLLTLKSSLRSANEFDARQKTLTSLSIIYSDKGLYDSAAYYYETSLAHYSTTTSWQAIGDACYKAYYFSVDEDKAAEWALKTQQYYQKVLNQDPEQLDVKARLAMTYTRGKNPMKAVLTLREVLDKQPENEQALLNIGLLSIQSGQHEKAIERFKKLLTVNPQNWLGMFYLGIGYAESGKKKEAIACFEKVKKNEKQSQIVDAADQYLKQLSVNP